MNKDIYTFLYEYFEKTTNSTNRQIANVNKYFNNVNRFEKEGLISGSQKDLIIEDMCCLVGYALKIISDCPYLEIHLRKIYKNTQLRKSCRKKSVDAIGFQYDSDDEEIQCVEYCTQENR